MRYRQHKMSQTGQKTVKEIFQKIAIGISKHPELVKEVNAVYLFRISGQEAGCYHVDLKDNPGVTVAEKPAECILDVKDRDFKKLVKGILPGFKAMLCGKLKVTGDLTLATRLNDVFRSIR